MNKYTQLLSSRKNYRNGKARGFEWKPTPMPYVDVTEEDGIRETLERCLAIALVLELPAGEWAGQASKGEIPEGAKELLLSNAADETVHFRAFSYLNEIYSVRGNGIAESEAIMEGWDENTSHPIEKVCLAETAIFLPSLAFMRVFCGSSVSHVAGNVSRDEQRHVRTNRSLLADLQIRHYQPSSTLECLRKRTLDWMFAPLTIPGMKKEFWIAESERLVSTGRSRELQNLTASSDDNSFLEMRNSVLY